MRRKRLILAMGFKLMSDLLSVNRQLLHLIVLLNDLAHRARFHNHAILLATVSPAAITADQMSLQVSIRFCLLLMKHLINDVRLAGPLRNTIVVELRHGRLLPFI